MKRTKSHIEKIQCPECGMKQMAVVEHTPLWNSYVHTCQNKKCKYVILESEWVKIK